jgi:hypothetical protein
MEKEKLFEIIKTSVKEEYNAMIMVGALYKKIYGDYPKIGLSGQQAIFIDELLEKINK